MNIKAWNILLVVALLAVLGAGGYVLYQNNLQKQEELRVAQEQEALKKRQEAMKAIEDFLNEFLAEINDGAREYKKQRTVLMNLTKPENMSSSEYIAENASLAESTQLSMQMQMDKIMGLFEKADQKLETLLPLLQEEDRPAIQEKWTQERKTQSDMFRAYFASERDVLKAQDALMKFYVEKKDGLTVDAEKKSITFATPEDQQREAELKDAIKFINQQQAALLKQEEPKAP